MTVGVLVGARETKVLPNNNLYKTTDLGYVLLSEELRATPRYGGDFIRENMAARSGNHE